MPVTGGVDPHRGQRRWRAGRHAVDARRQDHGVHAADRRFAGRKSSARLPPAALPSALTHLNDATLNACQTDAARRVLGGRARWRARADFVVKPYGFQAGRKYPVLMLIHGGPQGIWGHSWTYRWNAQVFAAAGYVVVEPNPRGSTGYGQKFIDEINDDWGGTPFDDIMAVTDHVVANLPYADAARMAAAGGSYGGYMVDWILGHTAAFQGARSRMPASTTCRANSARPRSSGSRSGSIGGTPWDKPRRLRQVVAQPPTSRTSTRPRW